MGLPQLYVQPNDAGSWIAWAFNHAANHYDIVTFGTAYQQAQTTLATSTETTAGNSVLEFDAVNNVVDGMLIADVTNSAAISAGTIVTGFNATEVGMSANAAQNVDIGDSILFGPQSSPLALTQYPLTPLDPNSLGTWLYYHQVMHNQINGVLGTTGYDLLDYDWTDPDQLSEWLRLNGDEHVRICTALGVT